MSAAGAPPARAAAEAEDPHAVVARPAAGSYGDGVRTIGTVLLRVLLQLASVLPAALLVMPLFGGLNGGGGVGRFAGLAAVLASVGPIWIRRSGLGARLGAYGAGVVVGSVLVPAVAPLAVELYRRQVVPIETAGVIGGLGMACAVLIGLLLPLQLLRPARPAPRPSVAV